MMQDEIIIEYTGGNVETYEGMDVEAFRDSVEMLTIKFKDDKNARHTLCLPYANFKSVQIIQKQEMKEEDAD